MKEKKMTSKLILLVVGILLIVFLILYVTKLIPIKQSNDSMAIPTTVSKFIKETHPNPFTKMEESVFDEKVSELNRQWKKLEKDEMASYYAIRKLIASLGDEHTTIMPNPEISQPELPFFVIPYDNHWIIVQAQNSYKELVGKELISINGVEIPDICEKLLFLISYETEQWANIQCSLEFRYLHNLSYIHVTDNLDSVSVTVKDTVTNQEETREVKAITGGYNYQNSTLFPLAQTLAQSSYYYATMLDKEVLFVQYNVCADNPDMTMSDFAKALEEQILSNPPKKVIIDLRHNGGGNSEVINPLLPTLEKLKEKGSSLYCLIGAATFSSAVMNAVTLQQMGAVLVGEPTGGVLKFGDLKSLTLPNGAVLNCSTKDFSKFYHLQGALVPDISVIQTVPDFLNGVDSVVEYIKAIK